MDTKADPEWLIRVNRDLSNSIRYEWYREVKVLALYWEVGATGFKDEAYRICSMFSEVFGYHNYKIFAIPSVDSYTHVAGRCLSCLARTQDGPSLLIIHYGGHGDPNDDRHSGQERRSVWAAFSKDGPTLDWYRIQEQILESGTDTDVLLLLDCCFAATAARNRQLGQGRFEVLAASAMGMKTPQGDTSFTNIITRELPAMLRKQEYVAISDLHSHLCKKEQGLYATPVHIHLVPGNHSIRLERIQGAPLNNVLLERQEMKPVQVLQILVQLRREISTTEDATKVSKWLQSDRPTAVAHVELVIDRTKHLQDAVADLRDNQKGFTQTLSETPKEKMLNMWSRVLTLLKEFHVAYPDACSPNNIGNRHRQYANLIEELDRNNEIITDMLEQAILLSRGIENERTLDEAAKDENMEALGISSSLQLRKIACFDADSDYISTGITHNISTDNQVFFVETKRYGPYVDPKDVPVLEHRVKQLAGLLGAPKRTPFRCLRCVSWTHREVERSFILEFETPSGVNQSKSNTLFEIIENAKGLARPSLDDRLRIALKLAKAVFKWHSIRWLHQGINSHNVHFFKDTRESKIDYSNPWLQGFEFARPDSDPSLGHRLDDIKYNVFQHPERQGPARKGHKMKHDIYSLGVVLLEIGLWQTARDIVKRLSPTASPLEIQKQLQKDCAERLYHFAGETFQNVVDVCLGFKFEVKFDDESGSKLLEAFQTKVVECLEKGIKL